MNANTVVNLLLIGAAAVWVLARQVQPARVKPRLLWLAPLILACFGIRALPAPAWHLPADLGLLVLGAAVSAGLGVGAARPSACGATPTVPGGARDRREPWSCGAR